MKLLGDRYGIHSIYQSQMDCIWMLKQNGGGICDFEVGCGKTLIMCIATHEMKRLGLAHKPMIIGLKANVAEIAMTYKSAYPNARILFADEKSFKADNRVAFFNQIKNNDYDCVIMSHDQFGKIPQSLEMQQQILQAELDTVEENLEVLNFNELLFIAYIIHRGVAENAAMAGHGARASKFQLDIKSVLDFWVSAGQFWAA